MKKVLLIEDYPVIQELYGTVLEDSGFEVDLARDGKDALAKVGQNKYDIILLDLLLPEVNGIQFLQQFKDRGDTKIIVLSDFDYEETVKEARELGVIEYWLKAENTPHVLVTKLKHMLREEADSDKKAKKSK